MNLEQIKENLNKSWNKNLMQIGIALVGITLALEILIFGFTYGTDRITVSLWEYILKMIMLPTGLDLLVAVVMFCVYKCNSIGWICKYRETILCYCLFIMFSCSAIVYRYYHVLWIAPCVCQYLHSVYTNRKGARTFYIITNIFAVLITFISIKDGDYEWEYFAMTFICTIGMLYLIYTLAKLLSGFHSEQLEYLQESYSRQEELITELKIEPMTGLYNRSAMPEKIDRIVEDNEKKSQESYIAMMDLDHFKRINDTYGHMAGDDVIRQLAALIKKHMNADIEGFRFGGEEFTLVFRNKTKERVLSILHQICREMEESRFDFDSNVTITLSVGVSGFEKGINSEVWIQRADAALYDAKKSGRNQIKIAN